MSPDIPKRCRFVYDALTGKLGHTDFTARHGRWRYIDIIAVTGRNSSERKLRELIEACPGLVKSETRMGDSSLFKTFWIVADRAENSVHLTPVTTTTGGMLFDLAPLGRPE